MHSTSTPFVSTPAPVVEQPWVHAKGFPTLWLVESPELLSLFGWSSPSPSPTLPWGAPRCRGEQRRTRLPRGSGSPPAEGVLLPTTLDDFDDSVLGDPITYARCEHFPGSESPLLLPVYAWPSGSAFLLDSTIRQIVLAPVSSALPAEEPSTSAPPLTSGEGRLLETRLPGCPYRFSESGELPFTDGNPAYGLQLHHPRFLELVGAPESARLLDCSPTFWVDQLGQEQAMQRPLTCNGTQVLCYQICRYCHNLLWR